jgi:AraC-like DNA-binding protein
MRAIPLTRIAAFSPFPKFLAVNGCDVARQLSSLGIDPEALASEESLVPLQLACEFIEQVSDQEGIDGFGLKVGQQASILEVGLFGKILSQSLTLNDLIQKIVRWIPSIDSGARVWLAPSSTDPDCVQFCLRHDIGVGRAQIDAYGLLIFIDAVRLAAGPDWRPKRASLDAAAGDPLNCEALSEAAMNRRVNHVSFDIPRAYLGLPVSNRNRSRPTELVQDGLLERGAPRETLTESICQTIAAGLGTRIPTINQVAQMAGLSVSTLQRRLRDEGLVYGDLVDRIRYREAQEQLDDRSKPMSEIARHLGYAHAANFTHAFRRWTGVTPTSYRGIGSVGQQANRSGS